MRIAIHDHEADIHKLYDSAADEIFTLDEEAATQVDVNANGHLVKDSGNWTLEVPQPIVVLGNPKWRTPFAIDADNEAAALGEAKAILSGKE